SGFEGSVVFDREYLTFELIKILKKDFGLLVSFSLLLVFVILVISYGRIELGIITFLPILISWLWTLGIMGAFGIKFNIFNIIISTFIFGLGIDYSIFIMRGLLQQYKYGRENLSSYKTSIFLSVFTTITGLGVLIFAQHPALRSIAWLSIIGILSVVIVAYTLEPLMFRWLVYIRGRKRTAPVTLYGFIYAQVCYAYFFVVSALVVVTGITGLRLLPTRLRKRGLHWLLTLVAKSTIYIMYMSKKVIINPNKENFSKPAIIIANHQSLIDIPLMIMLSPKTILLSNDWVWGNQLMGTLLRQVDFYPVSMGLDELVKKLRIKVDEGYSIIIFPEGTRAEDLEIKRFHKGAFYLAEKLNLDIIPIIIHGSGHCVTKHEYYGNKSTVTLKFLDRIKLSDTDFGTTVRERTKRISAHFRKEFDVVKQSYQYPAYYRDRLLKNYLYKGPVLEWYTRIKTGIEDNYKMFHELIPKEGKIVDVGCGYGYLPYMLNFLSEKRDILGIDYDKDKIDVANNCMSKNQNVNFVTGDITDYEFENSDVFVLNDVLHYLQKEDQDLLVTKCIGKLNAEGKLIIRDGDRDLQKRHLGTRLSEFYSTNFGFNMTKNDLEFVSGKELLGLLEAKDMNVEIIDATRLTSNLVYVITHKHNLEEAQSNG
ncbi:MAG TPA: methyltransferase domain-containing protein, partial [Flavobacteriales bacterium]|nr:methyltransferase domain-containing protein [Flavobacteriales bacterium]